MKKAVTNKWSGSNQTDGIKNMSSSETATINELIIETHRFTKQPLYIHQNDAMRYYGRIIRPHAMLNSRKFGIPENVCQLHIKSLNNIK